MEKQLRVCVDKTIKGKDPYKAFTDPQGGMAVLKAKRWDPGQTLRIKFLGGTPTMQQKVQEKAKDWLNYGNIKFEFISDGDADIRIDFQPDGSWSYIGNDAKDIPQNESTMNYGWLDDDTDDTEYSRVVKHEFGHALGAIHEHQNPQANIPWNKPKVYEYFMGPPNNWSKEDVDHNLFERYSQTITNSTKFDERSIMIYHIAAEFTLDNVEIGAGVNDLSDTDKEFMKTQYP